MGKEFQHNITRDYYADFLKYLLVWLVVLGHFISNWQRTPGIYGSAYSFIYSFHVPLFVFISGYFSKISTSYRKKNLETLLYPFVIFQLLYLAYFALLQIPPSESNFFYPYHQNWYLIALFWWRSFIPYGQFLRKEFVIALSFIISLGVGFFSDWGSFLGLYKTAFFLPFFVLGAYCNDLNQQIDKMMKYKWIWICLFVLLSFFICLGSFNERIINDINYGFKAASGYGESYIAGLVLRSLALSFSLLMCPAVLVVVKILYRFFKLDGWKIGGGGTMLVYLAHWYIMEPLLKVFLQMSSGIAFSLCIISSMLITWVLTRKKIVDFFAPLLDMSKLRGYLP